MRVLVGCEYSGIVRNAFRELGHDAYSCDLLKSDDNSKYHIKDDLLKHLDDSWDLGIFHPPCTYLCVSGAAWYYHPEDKQLPMHERRPHPKYPNRREDQRKAIEFVLKLYNCDIKKICIENPIGVLSTIWKKPDQIIQPYNFGDPHQKTTCLWLKNLPKLQHTANIYDWDDLGWKNKTEPQMVTLKTGDIVSKFHKDTFYLSPEERGHVRSKTFVGIAKAMAKQWGKV